MFDYATAAVEGALGAGASYSDARVVVARQETIEVLNGRVERVDRSDRAGVGVRALVGSSWGFFATADLSGPAAGAAGLIKAVLSLYHKVLPPTIHCDEPHPDLQGTSFYVNKTARPWVHGDRKTPRRAAVNSFGFGGINAHVILEEYTGTDDTIAPSHLPDWSSEVCILQGQSRDGLL